MPESDPNAITETNEGTLSEPAEMPAFSSARHIVLLCDNPLLARDTRRHLHGFGHQVRIVHAVSELEGELRRAPVDCLIVDPSHKQSALAASDSMSSVRTILDAHSAESLPVLWLTWLNNFDTRLYAARAAIETVLTKPVEMSMLRDWIVQATNRAVEPVSRVLLVADDGQRAQTIEEVLENAGIDCARLHSPLDLPGALSRVHPELVLVDMANPALSATDLTLLIRREKAFLHLPIVVLTRQSTAQIGFEALKAGADDYLFMPELHPLLAELIAARIKRSRTVQSLVMRDGLTGLYNHRAIKEHLAREVGRSKRERTPLTVGVIDIDFFKKINDSYGHPVGDQVIRTVAQVLQARLRGGDLIGRYGGEEFLVILPATTQEAAVSVFDEVREQFSQLEHRIDGFNFTATFSTGVASLELNQSHCDGDMLFRAADSALYNAKRDGRNCVRFHAGST